MVTTPTLSALAGKLARQVLAVTLAKTRFCFALSIITVKLCGECAPRVFSLLFQRVTSGEAHGASARKNAVLLRFYLQYKALRKKVFIYSYITQNVKVSFTKILGIDIYGNFYQSVHYSGHFIYKRK